MRYRQGLWAILIICSALAALGAMLVLPDGGIKPFIVTWFLFVCPGMATVRLIPLKELVVKLMLALALSFSIDGLVAGAYLYANRWAPREIMFTLAIFSIGLVVIERTNAHKMLYQHVAFVQRLATLLTHPMIIGTGTTRSLPNPKSGDSDSIDELPTIQLASATITPTPPSGMPIEENPTLQLATPPVNKQGPLSQQLQEGTNEKQSDKMLPEDIDIEQKSTVAMPVVTPKPKNQFLWPRQKGKLQLPQSFSSEDQPIHDSVPAIIQTSEGQSEQPKIFDAQTEPPKSLDNQIHVQALDEIKPMQPDKSPIMAQHETSPVDQMLVEASEIKSQHAPPTLRRRRAKMVPLEK